jgi:hypothetical protein
MHEKRERARQGREEAHAVGKARTAGAYAEVAARPETDNQDLIPWLMQLGFKRSEARRAAAQCGCGPEAPLEERVKAALSFLSPAVRSRGVRVQPGAPDAPCTSLATQASLAACDSTG